MDKNQEREKLLSFSNFLSPLSSFLSHLPKTPLSSLFIAGSLTSGNTTDRPRCQSKAQPAVHPFWTSSGIEWRQDRAELPQTKPSTQLPHAGSGQPTTAPDLLELVRTSRSFKLHRSGLEDARRPRIKDHELFWSWSSSCATTTVRWSHPPPGMISMDLG